MKKSTHGFTLIELLVVVLIIGILAAIAVPQYFKVVEKGKSAEAFQWLSSLKGAQERYLAKNGNYSTTTTSFDVNLGSMKYFSGSGVTTTTTPSWSILLLRQTPTPAVYGSYIVTYIAPPGTITCNNTDCSADLLP